MCARFKLVVDRHAGAENEAAATAGRGAALARERGMPAELEIVRLTVDGLSNPEIGARLYMSRSTVKTHLSHVYAKLGVANRAELAS